MSEQETAAVAAAGDEALPGDPAGTEAPEGAAPESEGGAEPPVSRSKERREERKAEMQRLRQSEAEAQDRLSATEARLNRLRAAAERLPEPREAEFDKYEDYVAARTAYVSLKALDGRNETEIQAEIEERRKDVASARDAQRAELRETWGQHVAEAKSRYSDFDAVVFAPDVPITARVAEAIMATEAPADVAYRLAGDRGLAREVSAMSDLELGRALGRIEAGLSRPRPKRETSAPAPITPVTPSGTAGPRDSAKMTAAEWRAAREAGWNP